MNFNITDQKPSKAKYDFLIEFLEDGKTVTDLSYKDMEGLRQRAYKLQLKGVTTKRQENGTYSIWLR
jgi:hypothetical protein